MEREYSEFLGLVRELGALDQIGGLLTWDEETYIPPGAVPDRAIQKAALTGIVHERLTSRKMGRLLSSLRKHKRLNPDQKVVVREMLRKHKRATAIPKELLQEISKTESLAMQAWVKARKAKDYKSFEPLLRKMIGLKAKVAECVGYEDRPYDALLDEYEPYMKTSEVEVLFSRFRDKLVPVVSKILDCSTKVDESPVKGDFPEEKQRLFLLDIVKQIGYSLDTGRMDVAPHPFTVGSMRDVRITVRYDEHDLRPAVFGAVHEAGHGMYEQGFLEKYYHTPLAESISLGIHESQSRMWENIVGRGLPFWRHFLPKLQTVFPSMAGVRAEDFQRAVNTVKRSFIRVEADEVTYNLHVMLRFEVENAIFSGKLKTSEIPGFWNERFENYLGLKVPDDAQGCLQDIHWSIGALGYFPTYSLGTIYATQLYDKAKKDLPGLEDQFAQGNFSGLLGWLRKNVHSQGKRYGASDLIKRVTGEGLNEDHFLRYLKQKYGAIYGISL
jgi:carboxypeptidase Taq